MGFHIFIIWFCADKCLQHADSLYLVHTMERLVFSNPQVAYVSFICRVFQDINNKPHNQGNCSNDSEMINSP